MTWERDNRAFLTKYDPELLAEIDSVDAIPFQPVAAKKRGFTAEVGGRWVHSKYDPIKEAEKAARGEPRSLHVHLGFGFGHLVEVDAPEPGGSTLVFEPVPALVAAAFRLRPLEPLLRAKRARVCCSPERFKRLLAETVAGGQAIKLVESPFHAAMFPDAQRFVAQSIGEARYNADMALKTLERLSPTFTEAALRALARAANLPDVARLAGVFKGMPAVIVSAGPSLDKNIAELRAVADRCLVIAMARTARPLERWGVQPHILVHNEPQPYFHLINVCANLERTAFVLCEQAEARFFQPRRGPAFVFQNPANLAGRWFDGYFPKLAKSPLETGGSVATEAFSLACLAGCNPVVLLGQDLSVKSTRYYAAAEANINFPHREDDERWVPGLLGGQVKTMTNYLAFILWFQDQAALMGRRGTPVRLVNATEGGASLAGFERLKFREAAARFPRRPVDAFAILDQAGRTPVEGALSRDRLTSFFRQAADQARAAQVICGRFPKLERRLRRALTGDRAGDSEAARRGLATVDRLAETYARAMEGLLALSGFMQAELNQANRLRQSAAAEAPGESPGAMFKRRTLAELDSRALAFAATEKAARRFTAILKEVIREG